MSKNLVIVESPAKAKTIGKILGPSFVVKSSIGHVRDLPERSLGVDIENGFEPDYVLSPGKKKVVDELRKAAKECDAIYLAPDPDREGEAIAWHLQEVLLPGNRKKPFYRVQYNEITPRAVREAFEHTGELNMARVDAQQARRVLDRIVGYKVSPVLWKRVQKGLSAGRVQSVALRLVCDRESEIEKFVPQPYWVFGAKVRKRIDPRDAFTVKLVRVAGRKAEIHTEEAATAVRESLAKSSLAVRSVGTKTVTRHAFPPFITSTLQQSASNVYGFSPSRTMSVAQKLYEGVELGGEGPVGLITYMRTDSVNISNEARDEAREYISSHFGAEFYPAQPNVYRSRNSAQEAHEAIRPTDVSRTPQSLAKVLDPSELKLYELIWKRFVASQMASARIEQRTAIIDAVPPAGDACQLSATASEVVFAGYMKVTGTDLPKEREDTATDEEGEEDVVERLPPLVEGEPLDAVSWLDERKETKPPARFSEASLVKALEANGVGRPSTYASIIGTLNQREYVVREKRTLVPTELGRRTNDVLAGTFATLFDVGFTASMETELDEVEAGREEWKGMLARFYERFSEWMQAAKSPGADTESVRIALEALTHVQQWAPEVQRGKRTYSDEKFVVSLREQFETAGGLPITDRQLEALLRILCRYRPQLAQAEDVLRQLNRADLLEAPELQPPRESTKRKLGLLATAALSPDSARFVGSLARQVESGRRLSDPQLRVLDDILAAQMGRLEGLTAEVLAELEVAPRAPVDATGVRELLDALGTVKEWRPASTRGKRVYDDEAFTRSVTEQFGRRGDLSPAQLNAVKRMAARYHAQIANYADVAAHNDLPKDGLQAPGAASGEGGAAPGEGGNRRRFAPRGGRRNPLADTEAEG
jgi:DNA topoisomerase-1